jgi:uncharacterized Fe-S cluster protein YjdI
MTNHKWLAFALLSGCVSGTTYQRATALQESPSKSEVQLALKDPNWKLRCLAARACFAKGVEGCRARVQRLAAEDQNADVRACAFDAIADRCDDRARTMLATMAQAALADVSQLTAVLRRCPSGDALLAVAGQPGSGELFTALAKQRSRPPEELGEKVKWLSWLETLPAPTDQVATEREEAEKQLTALRAQQARDRAAEAARVAAEADRKKKQQDDARDNLRRAALGSDLALTQRRFEEAAALGVDMSSPGLADIRNEMEARIAAEAQARCAESKHQARKALRSSKPDVINAGLDTLRAGCTADEEANALDAEMVATVDRIAANAALDAWFTFGKRCQRTSTDMAALERVRDCNGACQHARRQIQADWEVIQQAQLPPVPSQPALAEKAREICERSGCPNCQQ